MMIDKIQQEFLNSIQQMAEQEFQLTNKVIKEHFSANLPGIEAMLMCKLKQMLICYKQMESDGLVGELRYIYISYLRSSIMCGRPCYQIDFYDSRDRISDIECAGDWSFNYVFDGLYVIRDNLKKEFEKQTRVGIYELDQLTYRLADRFHGIVEELVPFVIKGCLQAEENVLSGQCMVTFMFGDYLDKSEKVITCYAGKI